MKRSALIAMLRRHEGVEPYGYQCSEGKLTAVSYTHLTLPTNREV